MKKLFLVVAFVLSCVSASAQTPGVTCEYWMGATLSNPQDLANSPNLLGRATTTSVLSAGFFGPTNKLGGQFVARCTTKLVVPTTGRYTFWIAANKIASVWISTTLNFAGLTPLCKVSASFPTPASRQWTLNAEQISGVVSLTAGGTYYLQVIHVATSATNHLALGWQLPSLVYERPISGIRLRQVAYPSPSVSVSLVTDKYSLVVGQAATMTWSSSNAALCTASAVPSYQYWTGVKNTSGVQFVTPLVNTVFNLVCGGTVNTGSTSLPINVTPAETLNPRVVEFDPSDDHNTALVTGYELQFYILGAVAPFQSVQLGKPSPGADGKIRVDYLALPGLLVSWPIPVSQYQAKVSAWGSSGSGLSDFSNTFTVVR